MARGLFLFVHGEDETHSRRFSLFIRYTSDTHRDDSFSTGVTPALPLATTMDERGGQGGGESADKEE